MTRAINHSQDDLRLSACIELLFAEAGRPVADRVRAAAAAGCDAIEFWTWRDKPLEDIADAAAETGVAVSMMIVEPPGHLVDPARRPEFLQAMRESAAAAARIGCQAVVAVSGNARQGASNADQDQAIVDGLRDAAPIAGEHGVRLLFEPLNTNRDHPGTYVSRTELALDLVEHVDRPGVGLLYDVYHSVMMGEEPARVLEGRGEWIGHVHVADTNGRHEPGTGTIDWAQTIAVLRGVGYRGFVGLEYVPTVESAKSMHVLRDAISVTPAPRWDLTIDHQSWTRWPFR
jgi:hydroxypyruvate isomerase